MVSFGPVRYSFQTADQATVVQAEGLLLSRQPGSGRRAPGAYARDARPKGICKQACQERSRRRSGKRRPAGEGSRRTRRSAHRARDRVRPWEAVNSLLSSGWRPAGGLWIPDLQGTREQV